MRHDEKAMRKRSGSPEPWKADSLPPAEFTFCSEIVFQHLQLSFGQRNCHVEHFVIMGDFVMD